MRDYKTVEAKFTAAVPVWAKDREAEMNLSLVFRTVIPDMSGAILRVTGHSIYHVYVNGRFIASGPARTAHGFYRVDELRLAGLLTAGKNVVAIVAAGYNVDSYYITDQTSFVCAEIIGGDGHVIAATDTCGCKCCGGFEAIVDKRRVQKVQRGGFQRSFSESYVCASDFAAPERCPDADGYERVELAEQCGKKFIERLVYYPGYEYQFPIKNTAEGTLCVNDAQEPKRDWGIANIENGTIKGYKLAEIEHFTAAEADKLVMTASNKEETDLGEDAIEIDANRFRVVKFCRNVTGFISMTVEAEAGTVLYAMFDELTDDQTGLPNYGRLHYSAVVVWKFAEAGKYELLCRDVYTLQYLNLASVGGKVKISDLCMREYAFPSREITAAAPKDLTPELLRVYEAAVETFRQNAVDIYMDCPHRERAGWLCDSYFTAQTEHALTGRSRVEKAFIENFLLPEKFEDVPDGMLPMCYPSDHRNHNYIPNWAMWFVLQLRDYRKRTDDRLTVICAEKKVRKLLDFLRKYENEDGLLEKLDAWVFIEWSRSNDLVQDISYPSNMIYAMVKDAAGEMYGDETLRAEAAKLRETIREKALTESGFYCDNSVYCEDGAARLSGECTETCQYYAFLSGVADKERDAELWNKLTADFGPQRVNEMNEVVGAYPEIAPSNTFIGIMLRLTLLRDAGLRDLLRDNIRSYFLFMADKTGTLWENQTENASLCHGFASFAAALLHA